MWESWVKDDMVSCSTAAYLWILIMAPKLIFWPVPSLTSTHLPQQGQVIHETIDAEPAADPVAGIGEWSVKWGWLLHPAPPVDMGKEPGPPHPHVSCAQTLECVLLIVRNLFWSASPGRPHCPRGTCPPCWRRRHNSLGAPAPSGHPGSWTPPGTPGRRRPAPPLTRTPATSSSSPCCHHVTMSSWHWDQKQTRSLNCSWWMMIQPSYLSMELGYRSWTGRSHFPDDDERLRTPDTERGWGVKQECV